MYPNETHNAGQPISNFNFLFFQVFAAACKSLQAELAARPPGDHLVWDKDDKSAMDFVTACSNVRAHIFNIPLKSRFEIKCKYTGHGYTVIKNAPLTAQSCFAIYLLTCARTPIKYNSGIVKLQVKQTPHLA